MTTSPGRGPTRAEQHDAQPPLLGGRHRLRVQVGSGTTELWRADDQVLARPVAVRLLRGPRPVADTEAYLDAATRAGRVSHPGVSRVLDAFSDSGTDCDVIVTEWVDRATLAETLADGPLAPAAATTLLRRVLAALSAIHQADAVHGRLHPGNIHVGPDQDVVVTDPEVAAALAHTLPPADSREAEAADVRAAGAVYFAALTGRWPLLPDRGPGGGAGGVPAAPRVEGRPCRPRQVVAGVPRAADQLAMNLLGSTDAGTRLVTLAAAARAAQQVADELSDPEPAVEQRPRRRVPRWVKLIAALLLIAGVGVIGWQLGLAVGRPPGRQAPTVLPTISGAAPGSATPGAAALGQAWPVAAAKDLDPLGDGTESPDKVSLAIDGDPSTAWTTDRYKTAAFGGLKSGVGLVLDLGQARQVGSARLVMTTGGADVELRSVASGAAPTSLDGTTVVARVSGAGTETTLTLDQPVTGRYFVVWITQLPPDGPGFRAGLAEAQLVAPGA